ncbi:porin family protein [Methylocystis sp. IM3]|jgi:outer membrane immunogenic protein|uniref:outer membrane protein n=1 Tax=unclassified Methylocystis TaxID=2625913 RepID=UPI000FB5DD6B|nr:MAG: porin family protein [Hyphomicrobiales bacterium]
MAKSALLAGVALALVAGSAIAADLPSRKAPPPAFVPPPPAFSWTGLYGGVNIGYGFGASGTSSTGWGYLSDGGAWGLPGVIPTGAAITNSSNINGVTGGGQIGYNYQFSPWLVVGVEADIQAADINSRNAGGAAIGDPFFGTHTIAVNAAHYLDWWGTVRGRVGVTLPSWPNLMVYGTGGFAYGGVNRTVSVVDSFNVGALGTASVVGNGVYDNTSTGWTAGGGVEWTPMAFPAWSLKVEYLYTDLGSTNLNIAGISTIPANGPVLVAQNRVSTRFNSVRAGVNWHFNPFGSSAPVLAKY